MLQLFGCHFCEVTKGHFSEDRERALHVSATKCAAEYVGMIFVPIFIEIHSLVLHLLEGTAIIQPVYISLQNKERGLKLLKRKAIFFIILYVAYNCSFKSCTVYKKNTNAVS
jgi:hypothetical protein